MKLIILISFLLSIFSVVSASTDEYNRDECDDKINVKRYLVAGSLDNKSAGGKTYSFDRIVGAIENELLSGQPPDAIRFTCLSLLHKKAHEDATDYWITRLASSACADAKNEVPAVKPPNCDDDTWDKFHRSKKLIDRSAKRITQLKDECVERDGNRSCDAMATLRNLKKAVEPVAETVGMDKCCSTTDGSAFRVLRGFYTVEFGDMNDAELQKECYKRTRPSNKVGGVVDFASTCIKSAARGIAEAVMKWFKTAKAIYELGSISEIWRIVRNMSFAEVAEKIGALVSAMVDQLITQLSAWNQCFTGPYKVDQACKLASSIAVDFFVGGGIVKGIGFLGSVLKAGVKDMAGIAKNMLSSSPKVTGVVQKLKQMGPAGKASSNATAATSAATREASKRAAANLAVALRPVADFSKSVMDGVRKLRARDGSGIRRGSSADRIEPTMGPNAATAVPITPTASTTTVASEVATQTGSRAVRAGTASSASGSSSSGNLIQLSTRSVKKIEKDIRAFKDANYKAMSATRVARAVDAPESLFVKPSRLAGKNSVEKMKIIEDVARAKRAQVERLANTSHSGRLSQVQAREISNNMEDALARIRARYGLTGSKPASTSAGGVSSEIATGRTGAAAVNTNAVDSAASASAKTVDTAIPTSPAPVNSSVVGSQGSIGSSAVTPSTFTNTTTSFVDALPKVDISSIAASSARMSKAVQKQLDDLDYFVQKARTNAANANPSSTARSSIYRNQSNRAISRDAIRRHGEIENLYKKGIINDEQAHALHDIVRVTENSATGTATRFNTRYIVTPNANPLTFGLAERRAPIAPLKTIGKKVVNRSGVFGAPMTAAQTERYSDSEENNRYDKSTIEKSLAEVQSILEKPDLISKGFSTLKTETEILDYADQLRVRVKTIEANLGATASEDDHEELKALIESINKERDVALARIRNLEAPAPAPVIESPQLNFEGP